MKKKLLVGFMAFFIFAGLFTCTSRSVLATTAIADHSAVLVDSEISNETYEKKRDYAIKKQVIATILERNNSPLLESSEAFVSVAYRYELDPYLLPSITWLESSLGKKLIQSTYNPFGWGGGVITLESYDNAIETVGKGLRNNYYNRGARTVYDVGRIYAASPTWGFRVEKFMNTFYNEEYKIRRIRDVIDSSQAI